VDDEPLARRGIRQLLAPYADIAVVGECRDGREALRSLAMLKPDLLFLDVEMPGLDGLGVIRAHGAERMPVTVFVTAHDEFAVRAFEIEALDYLVKPLSERRFRATIARVRERLGARRDGPARLAVPTTRGELLIEPDEISWIASEDDHALVHARGQVFRLRASLAALAARLGGDFARVHRTAMVRLEAVRELRSAGPGREVVVVLRDGTVVPVSRRRLGSVKGRLTGRRSRSPH
jgi:two-component system LytT family response regulator